MRKNLFKIISMALVLSMSATAMPMLNVNAEEKNLTFAQSKGDIIEITLVDRQQTERDSFEQINAYNTLAIANDEIGVEGADAQLDMVTMLSKIRLEDVGNGNYILKPLNDRSEDNMNTVLDVESDEVGATVELSTSPNAYWNFVQNSDGTYKIKNAQTGLYLSLENTGRLENGNKAVQDETGLNWTVDFLNDVTGADAWMSRISDDTYLSDISLPATHDAAAVGFGFDSSKDNINRWFSTQDYYFGQTINAGVRGFDLRFRPDDYLTEAGDIALMHGANEVKKSNGEQLYFGEMLKELTTFLDAHPSETFVFLMTVQGSKLPNATQVMEDYMRSEWFENSEISKYFYTGGSTNPTMEELRGKIYVMSRFGNNLKQEIPQQLTTWGDNFGMTALNGKNVWAQDMYSHTTWRPLLPEEKRTYVLDGFTKTLNGTIPDGNFIFNYTSYADDSSATGGPRMNVQGLYADNWLTQLPEIDDEALGIVMLDYADFNSVKLIYETNVAQSVNFSAPVNVLGEKGTEFNVNVSLNTVPNSTVKLIDGVFNIPNGLELVDVEMNSQVSGGEINYNIDENGDLRFAYMGMDMSDLSINSKDLMTIKLAVSEDMKEQKDFKILANSVSLKSDSENSSNLDVSNAVVNVTVVPAEKEVVANARVLYVGDNTDIIVDHAKVVAVEFTNLKNISKIIYQGIEKKTEFIYSKEMSDKKGVPTYVAMLGSYTSIDDLNDISRYTITDEESKTIKFADTNEDDIINAQDALNTLSLWLRKTEDVDREDVIAMNVNADGAINTLDVLAVMENYIDHKEFKVISK